MVKCDIGHQWLSLARKYLLCVKISMQVSTNVMNDVFLSLLGASL